MSDKPIPDDTQIPENYVTEGLMDKDHLDEIKGKNSKTKLPDEHIKEDNGGFVKDGEVPEVETPKKKSKKIEIIVIVALAVVVLGGGFAYMLGSQPTYIQTDHGLPHKCILHVFQNKTGVDHINFSCDSEKFYNQKMFNEISGNITAILKNDYGITEEFTIKPLGDP